MKSRNKHKLYDCDRCKFTFRKTQLRKQRGLLVCEPCFDSVLEIAPVSIKFNSPRTNSTDTAAVTSPTIFTITTAGITSLSHSQPWNRVGSLNAYEMKVVGSPTTITANPQIVPSSQGTMLTLTGTSDVNTVTLSTGLGTDLTSIMKLTDKASITLVYSTVSALWCEASRSIGGV